MAAGKPHDQSELLLSEGLYSRGILSNMLYPCSQDTPLILGHIFSYDFFEIKLTQSANIKRVVVNILQMNMSPVDYCLYQGYPVYLVLNQGTE